METTTTAANTIRSNSKWLMIICSVVMALTVGSAGVSQWANSDVPKDIKLSKWGLYITAKEMAEVGAQIAMFEGSNRNEDVIDRCMLLKAAIHKKITVSDKDVVDSIKENKQFQDEKGNFSVAKYDNIMNMYVKLDDRASIVDKRSHFEKYMRNNLLIKKVLEHVSKSVVITDEEVRNSFHDKHDTISFEYTSLLLDENSVAKPTKEEISKYYEAHKNDKDLEKSNEIKLNYVFVPYQQYISKVSVTEEDQAKFYEENKEKFLIPSTDPEAEKKYRELKEVQPYVLSQLAKEKAKAEAQKNADNLLTEMSKHLVNNIVILKNSFDAIKPDFAIYGESESFSSKDGGEAFAQKVGDITALRQSAFSKIGELAPDMINLENGVLIYKAPVENETPARPKTLEEATAIITEKLITQNAWLNLEKKAEELAKLSQTGGWSETLASKQLEALSAKAVINKATGKDKLIIDNIISKKAVTGEFITVKSTNLEDAFYVVKYTERNKASDVDFDKEKDAIKEGIQSQKEFMAQYEFRALKMYEESGFPLDKKDK